MGGVFIFSGATKAQPESVAEIEVLDASGIKLEIFKRPKPPGTSKPKFPDDLIVSEGVAEAKRNWFPWDPTGANKYIASPECSQQALRKLIWSFKSAHEQGRAVNTWLERCGSQISSEFSRHSFLPLIKFATVNYDFSENPHIRTVRAALPDGRVLSGFVALKPDDKPRPFIIGKCGVFCSAQQSTTHRSFMMHLFDESPFHVLSLGNITGADFQANNKAFSVGGFDEGRQLYQIAQLVKSVNSPIARRISSVHVIGASLGGSGALYSGLYSSLNEPPGSESIQSVTALCPVVVMENSAKRLYTAKPISTLASFGTLHQLKDIFAFVPILGLVFPEGWRHLRGSRLYEKVTEAIYTYYHDWTAKQPWDLKPFVGVKVESIGEFWRLNDFRNFVKDVRIPTLAIAAENDDLVRADGNTKLLTNTLRSAPNPSVETVYFKQGNHCAFSVANGWANYSMLLREYILSHCPEAETHWKSRKVRLPDMGLRLAAREVITKMQWQAKAGDPNMHLKLQIFSPRLLGESESCARENMRAADSRCYRDADLKVPLVWLPLETTETPVTRYDVTSRTRFANTRFSVLDANGELVTASNRAPEYVEAWEWR